MAGKSHDPYAAIEEPRSRLMTAEAMLRCLCAAMRDEAASADGMHSLALVAEAAAEIVRQTIRDLDYVELQRTRAA